MKYLCFFIFFLLVSVHSAYSIDETSYRLGETDVINFSVYAGDKQHVSEDLTVDGRGLLTVPMIGSVEAEGLTLVQLEQVILKSLTPDYFVDPQVMLTLKKFHLPSFFLTGAVKSPGKYTMEKQPTLMELIGKAGGLASGYGRTVYITTRSNISQSKEEVKKINLAALLDSGGAQGSVRLKDGDKVHIPFAIEMDQKKTNFFIEGEVQKPGMYTYRPGITALTACVMAGGFNEFSAPNRAKIIRRKKGQKKEVISIDLEKVKAGEAEDVLLQPGDFIQIPETWL